MDGLRDPSRLDLSRHAVAQQFVDLLVIAVQAAAVVVGLGAQRVDCFVDLRRAVAVPAQVSREQMFLDVAVVVAVYRDDAVLCGAFGLADFTHYPLLSPVPSGRLNLGKSLTACNGADDIPRPIGTVE